MSKIKICGVNEAAFAIRAEELGADYLGLIFAEESPRCVTVGKAREIAVALNGSSRLVGVFTTATVGEIAATAAAVGFGIVQLHRRAASADIDALKAMGYEVWSLAGGGENADALVFDSSHGDGETVLRRGPFKTILGGGISAENLPRAFAARADVIDVSGSLESARGIKSIAKLESFWTVWSQLQEGGAAAPGAASTSARKRQCSIKL